MTELPYNLENAATTVNYYRWLARHFRPQLTGRVLEHGAGSGLLSGALVAEGVRPLLLTEPTPVLVDHLRARFEGAPGVSLYPGTVEALLDERGPAQCEAIVSSNVLEHIEDDERTLRAMHALLAPGGRLCLYVPARPELYGETDRQVGHVRRYRKGELRAKLTRAGFSPGYLEYRNLIGALAWLVNGKLLGKDSIGGGSLKLYDQVVQPITERVEGWLPPPYGMNLLALAVRG